MRTIAARVTYRFPFNISVVGRLLGESDGAGRYSYPITSTARLHEEAPSNAERSLGISYASAPR